MKFILCHIERKQTAEEEYKQRRQTKTKFWQHIEVHRRRFARRAPFDQGQDQEQTQRNTHSHISIQPKGDGAKQRGEVKEVLGDNAWNIIYGLTKVPEKQD